MNEETKKIEERLRKLEELFKDKQTLAGLLDDFWEARKKIGNFKNDMWVALCKSKSVGELKKSLSKEETDEMNKILKEIFRVTWEIEKCFDKLDSISYNHMFLE